MPEHPRDTNLLDVVGLYSGYGVSPVLHGLDFSLPASAMACILGRNGVGKTTLLRSIVGQLAVQQGDIRFDGAAMTALPTHERAHAGMAYVPQGRDIFPSLSVQDNLKAAAFGLARADWRQALEAQFDAFPVLREKAQARGAALSGGQQQILALARALMMRPRLLLLDEPSEGIQPSIVAQIAETIQHIHPKPGLHRPSGRTVPHHGQRADGASLPVRTDRARPGAANPVPERVTNCMANYWPPAPWPCSVFA